MNIHYLQHVPFEGLASIATWIEKNGHSVTVTRLFNDESLPPLTTIDCLIVLGGSMNIYEVEQFAWLTREKAFIHEAIQSGKKVLGICLGAQLIADVLGASVTRNTYKEIGWFPIALMNTEISQRIFGADTLQFPAFHWHGDTFALPPDAISLAKSDGCQNQAFLYKDRVLGLQFHLESTPASVQDIVQNCHAELIADKYVQTEADLLATTCHFAEIQQRAWQVLDYLQNLH
ncbi:type 1 glutamine amidotransferase [Beggiatoa leptomitoformis]|uniref:Amidotransferase n=1 Tax=Beggiatoa leptomitoformis TaxID=288004 RepID=A0A2N9YHR1_9GAMM|nr:type 1 glutamine amidotransferase [Beggiatoa leptomitoformis]ALG67755.1 amidotransferase [Beggiatoa leptomitoformis]AUI70003.1 amidotransferase [Beggiatoa leptomitoformis]